MQRIFRRLIRIRCLGVWGLVAGVAASAAAATGLPLRTVARIVLPGPSVRFDYTSIDPSTNRLYIAHMDASQLLVFDLATRRVVKAIPAPGVHGVLAVPQLGRVFASATDDHEVLTLDARTERVIARAPAGQYPDGIAYDPVDRRAFVIANRQAPPNTSVSLFGALKLLGDVPTCAMRVTRSKDGADLVPFTPQTSCACAFEAASPGSAAPTPRAHSPFSTRGCTRRRSTPRCPRWTSTSARS